MSARVLRRWSLALVVAAVIALVGYAAYLVWQVEHELNAAIDDAHNLKAAISKGDDAAVDRALRSLRDDSASAEGHTGSPIWSLMTHVPGFGDDARGVRVASQVADDLSRSGLRPLVQVNSQLDGLLPKHGRVDVEAVASLQRPVGQGRAAFDQAARQLAGQDPVGYVEPLKSRYRDLESQVDDAARALGIADRAVQVLPTMLGEHGTHHYLLAMQNNAEIRATGGLPGAMSLLTTTNGRVEMTRQVTARDFGQAPKPVLPLTPAEVKLYGVQLGVYVQDANFTPDFPRTAELMNARWEQRYHQHLDGVLSVDTVSLSYLLAVTGPVTVSGTTLTADNAVAALLHDAYVRYLPARQDRYFRDVARAVFNKVSNGVGSPQGLIRALMRAAEEHRIYVHDFDGSVQSKLEDTPVAGELATKPSAKPQVNVSFDDTTGAKMSYYLRYDVSVDPTSCFSGVQGLTGTAHIRSVAPADAGKTLPRSVTGGGQYGVPAGSQIVTVRIYGPVGGQIGQVERNGKPTNEVVRVVDAGRPVAMLFAYLASGDVADYEWTMKTGADQTGDTAVNVTPSVVPGNASSTEPTACS